MNRPRDPVSTLDSCPLISLFWAYVQGSYAWLDLRDLGNAAKLGLISSVLKLRVVRLSRRKKLLLFAGLGDSSNSEATLEGVWTTAGAEPAFSAAVGCERLAG